MKVTTFNLPAGGAKQTWTVEVVDDAHYLLSNDDGFSARGEVGKPLNKDGVTMKIDAIHASPGSDFTVTKYSTLGMIKSLQGNLSVTESGKDTGVMTLTFTGEDRDQIRDILNAITRNYQAQNIERKQT